MAIGRPPRDFARTVEQILPLIVKGGWDPGTLVSLWDRDGFCPPENKIFLWREASGWLMNNLPKPTESMIAKEVSDIWEGRCEASQDDVSPNNPYYLALNDAYMTISDICKMCRDAGPGLILTAKGCEPLEQLKERIRRTFATGKP